MSREHGIAAYAIQYIESLQLVRSPQYILHQLIQILRFFWWKSSPAIKPIWC
jgi:hypothetical protein